MEMDDFAINYRGFTPAEGTKAFFQNLIRRIQDDAPNSCFIKASVARDHGHFRGVIRINSAAIKLLTFAETSDLRDLGRELYEKLRKQLNQWKEERFQEGEGLGYQI